MPEVWPQYAVALEFGERYPLMQLLQIFKWNDPVSWDCRQSDSFQYPIQEKETDVLVPCAITVQ